MPESSGPYVSLIPIKGLTKSNGSFTYPDLGMSFPAPPEIVDITTSDTDFARALSVLDQGMFSTRLRNAAGQRTVRPGLLPRTESRSLPDGLIPAAMTVASMTARFLLPLLCLASALTAAALVMEADVLVLIGSAGLLFFSSVVLHEIGHLVAYRTLMPGGPAIFTAQIHRFRLIRRSLPPLRDMVVTLAGPCAGFAIPLLLSPGYSWWPLQFWASITIAVAHLTLLLRKDGDGAMLRAAFDHRRRQGANRTATAKDRF